MKNKRSFLLLVMAGMGFLLLNPSISHAQGKVNFSGKWVLNADKSQLGEFGGFSASELVIKQEKNTFNLDRTRAGRDGELRTRSETVIADGKEHKEEGENRTTTAMASWTEKGTKLTIKYDIEFQRQGETFTMKRTEVWTMDQGGKVLTIQSDSSSQRGETSVTLVYEKN